MDVRNVVEGFGERVSPDELRGGRRPDHFARYLFAAHLVSGRSVADLCCGIGYGSNLLHAAGARRVKGIDLDPQAISVAQRHYAGPEYEVASADHPLDLREFEVRICFEGIEHVTDPEQLLANMSGADLALISTPNADAHDEGFSGNPHHLREWTRKEVETMLSRHFSQVRMYFQWHHQDPLDQDWSLRSVAKAAIPVALKARFRPPVPSGPGDPDAPIARDYRVHPASYLSLLPPGLRYDKPLTWIAVCRG
jgi:SAM-dependent methyltransferase